MDGWNTHVALTSDVHLDHETETSCWFNLDVLSFFSADPFLSVSSVVPHDHWTVHIWSLHPWSKMNQRGKATMLIVYKVLDCPDQPSLTSSSNSWHEPPTNMNDHEHMLRILLPNWRNLVQNDRESINTNKKTMFSLSVHQVILFRNFPKQSDSLRRHA